MWLIVTGSRNFTNQEFFNTEMKFYKNIDLLIHGGARGVDRLAANWAKANGIPTKVFKADWRKGLSAGPKRNAEIAEFASQYDDVMCLALWDGLSKGTLSCINECNKKSISCYVVMI